MPSFGDSIFLFVLALLLFGPKKLPVLARELGKWVGEFRRASNEFKMQMEEELRQVEQADRQKQIAAMEAAAPVAPPLEASIETPASTVNDDPAYLNHTGEPDNIPGFENSHPEPNSSAPLSDDAGEPPPAPLPIAVSGDLSIMPPATGLPTPRSHTSPLGSLLDSIPAETAASSSSPEAVAVAAEDEADVR